MSFAHWGEPQPLGGWVMGGWVVGGCVVGGCGVGVVSSLERSTIFWNGPMWSTSVTCMDNGLTNMTPLCYNVGGPQGPATPGGW